MARSWVGVTNLSPPFREHFGGKHVPSQTKAGYGLVGLSKAMRFCLFGNKSTSGSTYCTSEQVRQLHLSPIKKLFCSWMGAAILSGNVRCPLYGQPVDYVRCPFGLWMVRRYPSCFNTANTSYISCNFHCGIIWFSTQQINIIFPKVKTSVNSEMRHPLFLHYLSPEIIILKELIILEFWKRKLREFFVANICIFCDLMTNVFFFFFFFFLLNWSLFNS